MLHIFTYLTGFGYIFSFDFFCRTLSASRCIRPRHGAGFVIFRWNGKLENNSRICQVIRQVNMPFHLRWRTEESLCTSLIKTPPILVKTPV